MGVLLVPVLLLLLPPQDTLLLLLLLLLVQLLLLQALLLLAPPPQPSLKKSCNPQEPSTATAHQTGTSGHPGTPCCEAEGRGTTRQQLHAPEAASLAAWCLPAYAAAARLLPGRAAGAPAAAPGGVGHQVAAGSKPERSTGAAHPAGESEKHQRGTHGISALKPDLF
jgi:hypothetical protein